MTSRLTDDQVTAAALAAVLKYPEWSKNIGEMHVSEIQSVTPAYHHNMSPDLFASHHGVAFLRWLQAELQHELNVQDVGRILLTIKHTYYR